MRLITLAGFLALALLVLPGSARADSALDQYVESVPGAGGDKPSSKVKEGGGGGDSGSGAGGGGAVGGSGGSTGTSGGGTGGTSGGSTIPPSELEALEAEGADGAAAAGLAAATAPSVGEGRELVESLLIAASGVQPGESLSQRYGTRGKAFEELYRALVDEGISSRVARQATRQFVSEYWRAEVPAIDGEDDESALSALLGASTGGGAGGLGIALPIILLAALLAAGAVVVARVRRPAAGGE